MVRRILFAIFILLIILMLRTEANAAPSDTAFGDAAEVGKAPFGYTVQAGDTLAAIALRTGTSSFGLAQANGVLDIPTLSPGQQLILPGDATPPLKPEPSGVEPVRPEGYSGRWIQVSLSKQRLTAYEGERAVYSTAISSGLPRTPTVVGTFAIRTKLRSQNMSGPGYFLRNVPHVMYFYAGYAIHGAYWHNRFGRPMSHGCVNLPLGAAAWMYNWASVGTPVVVQR